MANFKILILDVGIFRAVQSEYVFSTQEEKTTGAVGTLSDSPKSNKTNYDLEYPKEHRTLDPFTILEWKQKRINLFI
jgi:hypothetical protein